jgi:DNA-binding response OmpR family regulator
MKIALSTQNIDLINEFNKQSKIFNVEILNAKVENVLNGIIEKNEADAYIIQDDTRMLNKVCSYIKRTNENTPIIVFGPHILALSADILCPYNDGVKVDMFASSMIQNIINFYNKFEKLQRLTAKMTEVIEFANCSYDPTRRMLSYKGKEITKLSAKEGGIIETLAMNFGQVVKREIILEKVWGTNDYWKGRSMDVYLSHLRKMLEANKIKLAIKNISKIGLILE